MQITECRSTEVNQSVRGSLRQRIFRTRAEDSLPHSITHQRIYIVPSKRGCAFLFALLLMLIASVNYSLSLGYALCFLLTGLFAATLLHTYRNLAGLSVLCIEPHHAFAGQPVSFGITLDNQRTEARHGIRIANRARQSVSTRIEAEQQTTAQLKIDTQKRGILTLGRLTLQSDWPLGLWTSWSYLHVSAHALVYPALEAEAPGLPTQYCESEGSGQGITEQGDVSGLRDYVPGDSIGSIAWKSVARGLGLHVRTFESTSSPASTTLNLETTGLNDLESQLSRLSAWAHQAESANADYAIDLPECKLNAAHGREHHLQVMQALALHAEPGSAVLFNGSAG